MLCPSCGALINDNSSFCDQCGCPVSSETQILTNNQISEPTPTEVFSENVEYQPIEYTPVENTYQAPPVYQTVQPMYNQYQNSPMYNQPGYVGHAGRYAGLERPKRDTGKVLGILSLIFSLVGYPFLICYGAGLLYWLAALITGGIGLSLSKRNGYKNGRAKAGIIITLMPLIIAAVIGILCGGAYLIALLLDSLGLLY